MGVQTIPVRRYVVQSPTQSPVQSPVQGPPMKQVVAEPVQEAPPKKVYKKGIQNPLAIPVGIADGLVDFLVHCVGEHVKFLKDPKQLLKDPLGAIKINDLEINPMGHIFNSIEQANQRQNPVQQLFEVPMGLDYFIGGGGPKGAKQGVKQGGSMPGMKH